MGANGCRLGNGIEAKTVAYSATVADSARVSGIATAWAELTASQRAQAIKRRRQIWEALHPEEIEVEKVFPPQSYAGQLGGARPQEKGFAASTAAAAGMTKQAINQHLARADALGDDLERITGKVESDSTEAARVEGLRKGFATVCEGLPPRA